MDCNPTNQTTLAAGGAGCGRCGPATVAAGRGWWWCAVPAAVGSVHLVVGKWRDVVAAAGHGCCDGHGLQRRISFTVMGRAGVAATAGDVSGVCSSAGGPCGCSKWLSSASTMAGPVNLVGGQVAVAGNARIQDGN